MECHVGMVEWTHALISKEENRKKQVNLDFFRIFFFTARGKFLTRKILIRLFLRSY